MIKQKLEHSPTLNTVLMVEKTLKNMPNSAMKVSELKRALPKQVNHITLKLILDYLDKSGKIVIGVNGITWLDPITPEIRKLMKSSTFH